MKFTTNISISIINIVNLISNNLKTLSLLIFLFLTFNIKAQENNKYPFVSGEHISYDVYYHLGFIWLNAAQVSFSVNDTLYNGKKRFCFRSDGNSSSSYDWIFKVRDHFLSITNYEDLSPLLYIRNTKEGSHIVKNKYLFLHKKKKILAFINDSDTLSYKNTLPLTKDLRDVLTSTYFVRTIPFNILKIGQSFSVKTLMSDKIININVKYLSKEKIKHKNGKQYWCHKIETQTISGSVFGKNQKLYVWISADKNQIPLKISGGILVGSVEVFLNSVKNMAYPKELNTADFSKK